MDQYKEMYYTLFNKITDVINTLQAVQIETEEQFISQVLKPETTQVTEPDKR